MNINTVREILIPKIGRAIRFNETREKRIKTASILLLKPNLDKVRMQKISAKNLSEEDIFSSDTARFKRHIDSVQDRFFNKKEYNSAEILSSILNDNNTRKYSTGAIAGRIIKKAKTYFANKD